MNWDEKAIGGEYFEIGLVKDALFGECSEMRMEMKIATDGGCAQRFFHWKGERGRDRMTEGNKLIL